MDSLRDKWDARYREAGAAQPVEVLVENEHLLPRSGIALDLACGLGANALWLAARNLETHAWDLSTVAIERLRKEAANRGVRVQTQVRDVIAEPPPASAFDLIVVSRFLERTLAPRIAAALRPGGLLFYQTFTRAAPGGRGPNDSAFRLARNELLQLFPNLFVVSYREEDFVGDTTSGFRDEAMLVAQKPE